MKDRYLADLYSPGDPAAAKPLTADDIYRAMEQMDRLAQQRASERAQRAIAWANLRLDYDAMTGEEKGLVFWAQSLEIIHPADAKRVETVVAKYRRDREGP